MTPTLSLSHVIAMDRDARTDYFERFARFMPDAPTNHYVIRVGSTTLFSNDTYDLRQQFNRLLRNAARRKQH